jgi:tetratricopeptide (TPR) repeat protein
VDTIRKNPDAWLALGNLGAGLANQGKLEEAIEQYGEVLRINPDYPENYCNLGDAAQEKTFNALQQYLLSAEVQQEIAGLGRRVGLGR